VENWSKKHAKKESRIPNPWGKIFRLLDLWLFLVKVQMAF